MNGKEAAYYQSLPKNMVRCGLCPHGCQIVEGNAGRCGVRVNRSGMLYADSYGHVTSMQLDPIEKKPLRHFHTGAQILSLGGYGCNLRCGFCQNHHISMRQAPYRQTTPHEIAALSLELAAQGNVGVAYTYNEPLIAWEFVRDVAAAVQAQGQYNVLVTNGFISAPPMQALLPYVDAMNIDLKAYDDDFYHDVGGRLSPVLDTIALCAAHCHVEITTLIIQGKNDSVPHMQALSAWLAGISPDIPLHISRFHPAHEWLHLPPTPVNTVYRLVDVARQHLRYVYAGNC